MKLRDLDDQWLIKDHFFGIYKEDKKSGEVYLVDPQNPVARLPKPVLQRAIDAAIAQLESKLGLSIRNTEQDTEYHDYDADLYNAYMLVLLRHYPVSRLHSLQLVYGENGPVIWDVPDDTIQLHGLHSKFGMLQVLPMWGIANNYDPAYALLFPGVIGQRYAPSMLKVVYDHGLAGDTKDLPDDIVRCIGLIASMHPFNILGDIVIGAGIASKSISVDGISKSVNTTSSAENAAYSARIIMHRRLLYGEQGTPGLLQDLQRQWRRPPVGLL